MKLLLVGPYPPPHGGVSVHVRSLRETMERAGTECAVLNVEPRAPQSEQYIKIRGGFDFIRELFRHAYADWTLHIHTNGHNPKSWLVALTSGFAAQMGPGGWLTLHSGMLPGYLREAGFMRRTVARLACAFHERIICVNEEIRDALMELGVPENKLEVKEAYLGAAVPEVEVPGELQSWMRAHSPVLTTAMFMRPEYGYEVLQAAVVELSRKYPAIGCVVMGVDGTPQHDSMFHAGDIDHDLCLYLMAGSDAFVRPTFSDGDSISVREAHALGVPVVASSVGTRPSGTLLFPPGDVAGLVQQLETVLTSQHQPRKSTARTHPFGPEQQDHLPLFAASRSHDAKAT